MLKMIYIMSTATNILPIFLTLPLSGFLQDEFAKKQTDKPMWYLFMLMILAMVI